MTKEQLEAKCLQIAGLMKKFCDEKLDADYARLCEKLLGKLVRKRTMPLAAGKPEIWAMGIVHAIGTINFLFDKSFEPYVSASDLHAFYKTNPTSVTTKSKEIRDMFRLHYYDEEFSTEYMRNKSPFAGLVKINGFIVPLTMLKGE